MRQIILLPAAIAALALTACGESSGTAANGETTPRGDDEEQLAFARCMRENGVDVPDPGAGGGTPRLRLNREAAPQSVERAMETCREKTGGGPPELSADQREELQDAALKFARCMRENGVDMPDPQVGAGGGAVIRMAPGGRGGRLPDRESPAFRRAQEACRDLMPEPPGRGGR